MSLRIVRTFRQTVQMERGAPMADHFTILGKIVATREPPRRGGEPQCRILIGFKVAFHKVSTNVQTQSSTEKIPCKSVRSCTRVCLTSLMFTSSAAPRAMSLPLDSIEILTRSSDTTELHRRGSVQPYTNVDMQKRCSSVLSVVFSLYPLKITIAFNRLSICCLKSTMLRGAIRSGAADESRATWRAWLLASQKIVAYQRYRVGLAAANDGVATAPPPNVLERSRGLVPEEARIAVATPERARDTQRAVALPRLEGESPIVVDVGREDKWKLLTDVVYSLGEYSVAALQLAGVPSVLACLCMVFVILQQRDVRRLSSQVEELAAAVREMRNAREG